MRCSVCYDHWDCSEDKYLFLWSIIDQYYYWAVRVLKSWLTATFQWWNVWAWLAIASNTCYLDWQNSYSLSPRCYPHFSAPILFRLHTFLGKPHSYLTFSQNLLTSSLLVLSVSMLLGLLPLSNSHPSLLLLYN